VGGDSSLLSTGVVEGRVEESWGRGEEERGGGEGGRGVEREEGDTHIPLSAVISSFRHWSRALLV
jgi:hypothetical protein